MGMFVNNFLAPSHQTSSVMLLVTGDELIKFWKVKGKSWWERYVLY